MTAKEIFKHNNLPLRDEVFTYLRSAILKGEITHGTKLMEKKLADQLGVSRTPVREALRMLETEGLVMIKHGRGTFVSDISVDEIKDVLEIRASLEALAVKLSCKRIEKEEIEKLNLIHKRFLAAIDSKDINQIIKEDINFHDAIYDSTKNKKLIILIKNMSDQIYRFRVSYIKQMASFEDIAKEHEEIIKAISNGDDSLAGDIANEHIENQENLILETFKDKK